MSARELFEAAFGAPWRRGPIPTALDVLQRDLRPVGGWQSPRFLPEACLHGGTETPMLWSRQLEPDELSRRFVVGFDKHAAYLGVLGGLELGVGDPEHHQHAGAAAADPGYWRVACDWPPLEPSWPDALRRTPRAREWWITTPTLELAREVGHELEVLEAWTWPAHRRLLRPFGQRCQNARAALSEATPRADALRALVALKHVYAPILGGFLARLKDRQRAPRPPWYRPDWRHAIIAKARANLHRNMLVWRVRGAAPIGAYNDAVYFASDELPLELAARIGIRLDASLGGFTAQCERPLVEVLRDGRLNWRRLLTHGER